MAEFIIGNSLRRLAREHRFLRALLWRLDFLLIWLIIKLARLLPVDVASRFGSRVGRWIGPKLKHKMEIFRENMATAFPELSDTELDELACASWGRAGRVMAEYPHLDTIFKEQDRVIIDIREPIPTYTDPSRPCVIVTAHQSNWEIAGTAMARMNIPNACIYSPPTNPLLDRMLLDSRRVLNCELVARDNSARLLMRAMKSGRSAAMVIDRRVDDGKPVRFFGHDKPSTILPAKLAQRFNCELVPIQVERLQDARYRVTFHPPVRPTDPNADQTAQAVDMIQQVHNLFESWIRQQPQDWFCSKRLWPKGNQNHTEETGDSVTDVDSHAA